MPSAEDWLTRDPPGGGPLGNPMWPNDSGFASLPGPTGPEQSLKRWDCSQQREREHASAPLLTSIPDFNPGPGRAQDVYLILARTNKNILGSSINGVGNNLFLMPT